MVMELFSRTFVGWAVEAFVETRLTLAALRMARGGRQPEATLVCSIRLAGASLGDGVSHGGGEPWEHAITVYLIKAADTSFGLDLTPPVSRSIDTVCEQIRTQVLDHTPSREQDIR